MKGLKISIFIDLKCDVTKVLNYFWLPTAFKIYKSRLNSMLKSASLVPLNTYP